MSYMYPSKPEILRFQPIPPSIFLIVFFNKGTVNGILSEFKECRVLFKTMPYNPLSEKQAEENMIFYLKSC